MERLSGLYFVFALYLVLLTNCNSSPLFPAAPATPQPQQQQHGNQKAPDPCHLPAESGLCYAYIPSFYYDVGEDKCKPFVYGGCGGNANRFDTEMECGKFCFRCLRKWGKHNQNYIF